MPEDSTARKTDESYESLLSQVRSEKPVESTQGRTNDSGETLPQSEYDQKWERKPEHDQRAKSRPGYKRQAPEPVHSRFSSNSSINTEQVAPVSPSPARETTEEPQIHILKRRLRYMDNQQVSGGKAKEETPKDNKTPRFAPNKTASTSTALPIKGQVSSFGEIPRPSRPAAKEQDMPLPSAPPQSHDFVRVYYGLDPETQNDNPRHVEEYLPIPQFETSSCAMHCTSTCGKTQSLSAPTKSKLDDPQPPMGIGSRKIAAPTMCGRMIMEPPLVGAAGAPSPPRTPRTPPIEIGSIEYISPPIRAIPRTAVEDLLNAEKRADESPSSSTVQSQQMKQRLDERIESFCEEELKRAREPYRYLDDNDHPNITRHDNPGRVDRESMETSGACLTRRQPDSLYSWYMEDRDGSGWKSCSATVDSESDRSDKEKTME